MEFKYKYFIYGFVFGIIFPVVAFLLRFYEYGYEQAVTLALSDPLLWIIASAPLFLGILAYLAGKKQDQVQEKIRIVNESENKLKEANQKINETFAKLKEEHEQLVASQKTRKELKQLESAIEKFKYIISELGKYNLTVKLTDSNQIFGKHGNELAEVLCTAIANLRKVVQEEIESVRVTSLASERILNAANNIFENLTSQRNHLYEIDEDVTNLTGTIDQNSEGTAKVAEETSEVNEKINQLGVIFNDTKMSICEVEQSVKHSQDLIEDLYKSSEEINKILKVIDELAGQTNLLALNAAIEAARAGEHGRGFAVVADEVKKLADRTQAATGEIALTIQKIQTEIKSAAESSNKGTEKALAGKQAAESANVFLSEIIERINMVANTISELAGATEEQSKISNHIMDEIKEMVVVVDDNRNNVSEISEASKSLNDTVKQVETLVRKFKLPERQEGKLNVIKLNPETARFESAAEINGI